MVNDGPQIGDYYERKTTGQVYLVREILERDDGSRVVGFVIVTSRGPQKSLRDMDEGVFLARFSPAPETGEEDL